jgi:hypothetical protein
MFLLTLVVLGIVALVLRRGGASAESMAKTLASG